MTIPQTSPRSSDTGTTGWVRRVMAGVGIGVVVVVGVMLSPASTSARHGVDDRPLTMGSRPVDRDETGPAAVLPESTIFETAEARPLRAGDRGRRTDLPKIRPAATRRLEAAPPEEAPRRRTLRIDRVAQAAPTAATEADGTEAEMSTRPARHAWWRLLASLQDRLERLAGAMLATLD